MYNTLFNLDGVEETADLAAQLNNASTIDRVAFLREFLHRLTLTARNDLLAELAQG